MKGELVRCDLIPGSETSVSEPGKLNTCSGGGCFCRVLKRPQNCFCRRGTVHGEDVFLFSNSDLLGELGMSLFLMPGKKITGHPHLTIPFL